MTPLDAAVAPKSQPAEAPLSQEKHALDEVRLDSTPKFYETAQKGQTRPDAQTDEPKKKGLVQMEPGHGTTPDKYTYNPNQRNDRLQSMDEGKTADGTLTHKKFGLKADKHASRADGLTEEATLTGKNTKTVARKFDSSVNPHGLSAETVLTEGKTSTTTRGFDPESKNNKDGLKTEVLKKDDKGNESTTAVFKDGSRIEIVKANGKEVSTKKFDKEGKEIKEDGTPKNPADKTSADDKTPKTIDEQLKAYRAELEKGNDLPAIKRGKGPYDSIEEAVKKGSIKPMGPEEILSEARRIRDRDFKEKGRDYYKENEKLERYTKKEIDEKVAAKKVELEKAQPKQELPKPPETEGEKEKPTKPEGETDKPAKPAETKLKVENTGASPEFQAKVQAAVDALPDGVKKLLQDKGVSVAVAKEDPNGLFNAFSRNPSDNNGTKLSIAENVNRGSGEPVKTDDIDIRNAVAFAVQQTSDPPMNKSPEFQSAIKADLAKMTDNDLKERVSKMLETPGGQEQLFGKLFGERYMSGDSHAQEIQKLFPESSKWLDAQINKKPTDKAVEVVDPKEKQAQAERLTPSAEKIKEAMTPDIEANLKKNGLETDPAKIKKGITDAIQSDSMPLGVMQKRGDGDFPILAGYMGTGAINNEQRQQALSEQQQKRAEWRAQNPNAPKGDEFKQFQIGDLLREKFGKERIDAADALLKKLQPGK